MKKTSGDVIFRFGNSALLAIVALIMFFPIYYVVVVSLTDPTELLRKQFVLFPTKISLYAYKYLLSTSAIPRSIYISGILAVVGTVLSLMVTSSLAYALSRKRMHGRRVILLLILLTILFNPGIIPNYMLVRQLGLMNSLWSIILPSLSSGWNVLLMKGFFDSIPSELEDAAAIDGCNDITTWFRVVLPLSLPALAAFGLFFSVGYWNTFFNALLYLTDPSKWPIQVLLQNIILNASNTDLGASDVFNSPPPTQSMQMAAIVITTLPILVVYPFLQKYFAKGAMIGSIKE